MKQHNNQINNNFQETKIHGNLSFPIELYNSKFSATDYDNVGCHWHQEIEFMLCLEGKMEVQVNEKIYLLEKDNAVFINSNKLHSANIIENSSSSWLAIVFDSKLIYGFENSYIKNKYIDPIIHSKKINSLLITDYQIIDLLKSINSFNKSNSNDKELTLIIMLLNLWNLIYEKLNSIGQNENDNFSNSTRIKIILDFIHENYQNKISITDISNHINLCKSECQRFFKKEIGVTIIEYLIKYRIEKSLNLLLSKKLTIKEIAYFVGFNRTSYFCETFKKYLSITPNDFIKKETKN